MLHTTPCTDEDEHHVDLNPLNAELNPTCHLLALLGAHHIFHVSGLRVNHICGVLEPLEYSGTEVLLTVLGVTVQMHKQ
jgi:hypothetical protein